MNSVDWQARWSIRKKLSPLSFTSFSLFGSRSREYLRYLAQSLILKSMTCESCLFESLLFTAWSLRDLQISKSESNKYLPYVSKKSHSDHFLDSLMTSKAVSFEREKAFDTPSDTSSSMCRNYKRWHVQTSLFSTSGLPSLSFDSYRYTLPLQLRVRVAMIVSYM